MASFTSSGDNIDWLWGSLKPWQILHSTLAERQRCGNALDVWELVNQTLNASTLTRRQEGDGGHSHVAPLHFLGDLIDGDFWRHGGVMESRVKECLNRLKHEEEELIVAHHHHHQYHHHPSMHRCNTELSTIASNTQLPGTPRSIACGSIPAADLDDCRVEEHGEADDQEEMHDQAAALRAGAAAAEEGIHGYREEDEEYNEEEGEEEDEDSHSPPYPGHTITPENYSLISSNYEAKRDHRVINRDSPSILVLSPCCSPAAGAAAGDDQADAPIWGETAKLGVEIVAAPDLEENIEVCAVCLEKLTHYYEEGVQALACRHAFHTVCIGPWLQRQPHACCPCCRAPIFPDNLPPPLHLADHPVEEADHDQYACAGVHGEQPAASNDIMGLLADVEAALERLGFRC